jgi:hypothetical protein
MKALRAWWERRNAKLAQRELQREALETDVNQGAPLGDGAIPQTAGAAGPAGDPTPAPLAEDEPGRYTGD